MRKIYAIAIAIAAAAAPIATANATPAVKPGDVAVQQAPAYLCINANGVRYRTGPGTGYTARGTVNKGQGLDQVTTAKADRPADGTTWWKVNLWGGPTGVWIRSDFITTCY